MRLAINQCCPKMFFQYVKIKIYLDFDFIKC